jgi:nuclear-control-of-ATPase protein 2
MKLNFFLLKFSPKIYFIVLHLISVLFVTGLPPPLRHHILVVQMSSSDSPSFALDAVKRLNHRLDAIQDSFEDRGVKNDGGDPTQGEEIQRIVRIENNLNSQLSQAKALLNAKQLDDSLSALRQSIGSHRSLLAPPSANGASAEVEEVQLIAIARITYAAYTLVLDTLLSQAEAVNDQAWYWQETEEDLVQTVTYLIQTLPVRIINLVGVLSRRLGDAAAAPLSTTNVRAGQGRGENRGVAISRETIKQGWRLARDSPALAIGALFPLSVQRESRNAAQADQNSSDKRIQLVSAARILTPIGLTRHEARSKRRELNKERNTMAERLGTLAQHLNEVERSGTTVNAAQLHEEVGQCIVKMQSTLQIESTARSSGDLGMLLHEVITTQLDVQQKRIDALLSAAPVGLGLPSRMSRLWPVLVLGPVTSLIALRAITKSWDTILAKARDARETLQGFFVNWVYDPTIKLLDTIRTGEEQGMIVTPESLNSDLQSLERMVSEFSAEKYGLQGSELEAVAKKVREGDLTNVLKIYETELKSPLRSAVSGSLIRALLIQVQKVKVDIAVAMRGVDQLLKSQQLLFGAIGIAPAMGIIYVVGGFVRNRLAIALGGGQGGKRGVKTARYRAWEALRRIDRLLADPTLSVGPLPPLTQGLMLLDLTLLRKLAPQIVAQAAGNGTGKRATRGKRLRAEFLHDVRDLEMNSGGDNSALQATATPGLGWHARRAAVDRMWKSWGGFISLDTA